MDIELSQSKFVDSRYSTEFGENKKATFIVVKESFYGNNNLGEIDRVNIFIETYDADGEKVSGAFAPSIIGVGDSNAGVLTEDDSLLGDTLTWDNMEDCVIRLYD